MKSTSILALAPLILITAATAQGPGPAPRFDAWKIVGPGGGGTMIAPTVSPHDSRLVVEHCDMTGGYITRDGGGSWRMFNLRAGIETFAFDPGDPERIYAGNAALWRSDDSGRTWRMVFPNPAKRTVEHQNGDHADMSLTSGDRSYVAGLRIRGIAVDPHNSNVIRIAYVDPLSGGTVLLISNDGGGSFRHEKEFPAQQPRLLATIGGDMFAVTTRNIYRNSRGNWESSAGPGDEIESASAGETEGQAVVFVTTKNGRVFVSEDAGRTWQSRTPDLGQQSGQFGAIAASARNGRIAFAGFRGLKLGQGPENVYNGIAKTVDAGRSWSIVFRESTQPASNLDASWIEMRATGTDWDGGKSLVFDAPYSLGVAPDNPDICYATDLFRTYRTLDGGKTWAQVNSVRTPDNRWTTRGLDVTTSYGVQFDPFDARHVFIDYTDIGAFASYDGGQSWESATVGIPDAWRNTTYWLAFDPRVNGLMWGAFSGVHDLARPKMWRNPSALSRYRGGIGVSNDGGRHWTLSNAGMSETAFTHVLLDPASPLGQRTLYACGFGAGVYKSTDNGRTWQLKNTGIAEAHHFAWRIVQGQDGALYLIVARSNEGRYGEVSGSGALYKSIDGAEHWTKMNLPQGANGPNGLALDPRDNRRVYLAAWGQEREGADSGGGVFLSTDGGQNWRNIFSQSQHVYDVTIDPKQPDTLYICGFDAAAYRSTDAGMHWTRIRGYNFKWGHRAIVDPNDAAKIYITTFGGSVWHGPAAGDSAAIEDIVTPVPIAH